MNIERPLIAWDRCASALLLQKNYLPHFHHWLRWSRLERGPQKSQKARGETVRYLVQIRQGNRFLLSNFWQNPLELFLHDRICLPRIPSAASNKYEVVVNEKPGSLVFPEEWGWAGQPVASSFSPPDPYYLGSPYINFVFAFFNPIYSTSVSMTTWQDSCSPDLIRFLTYVLQN